MTSTEMPATRYTPVYPGEYEPLPRKKQYLLRALKKMHAAEPPVNIIEMADYYKIEIAVPGLEREDFFVYTSGCVLSVTAISMPKEKKHKQHFHLHGFNCECISSDITLPTDADTDFYTASYNNGILSICFYKNGAPRSTEQRQIIVY